MPICPQQDFQAYFKENMEALGLTVPTTLFQSQADAAAMIAALLTTFKTLGKNATIAELAGATTGLEKLMVLGALRASYYIGAAVGSFAVATGRYATCGASISDVLLNVHRHGVMLPLWLRSHFMQHSEILNTRHPARIAYATKARQ